MENPIIIVLVIAALGAIIYFFVIRRKKDKGAPVNENTVLNCINNPQIEELVKNTAWKGFVTPAGAQVWSTTDVPSQALSTIDRAIDFSNTVQKAQFPEWQPFAASDWEITFLPPPIASIAPQSKLPAISHGGVLTAGTVAHCNQTKYKERNGLFLPDFALVNWEMDDQLFRYVLFEGEHFREYRRDRTVFQKFVGLNDTHPHRHEGKPTADDLMPKTLMSRQREFLPCGFSK